MYHSFENTTSLLLCVPTVPLSSLSLSIFLPSGLPTSDVKCPRHLNDLGPCPPAWHVLDETSFEQKQGNKAPVTGPKPHLPSTYTTDLNQTGQGDYNFALVYQVHRRGGIWTASWWRWGFQLGKAWSGPGHDDIDEAKSRMLDHLAVSRKAGACGVLFLKSEEARLSHWPLANGSLSSGRSSPGGVHLREPQTSLVCGHLATAFLNFPVGHSLLHKQGQTFPQVEPVRGLWWPGSPVGSHFSGCYPNFGAVRPDVYIRCRGRITLGPQYF